MPALKSISTLLVLILTIQFSYAQTSSIKGRVYNDINNEPLAFATIIVDSTSKGTVTDIDGNYQLENLKPGNYNLTCSYFGFKSKSALEIRVTSTRPTQVDFAMVEDTKVMGEVVVKASPFSKTEESQLLL